MPDVTANDAIGSSVARKEGWTSVRIAIGACFVVLIGLAFHRNINWDEFFFLSQVHSFLDGRLDRPMQTFFVHGFGWLRMIPGTEVDQIMIARLVMVGFVAVTAYSVHRIARTMTDRRCADIAVLAFLTSGFALAHAGSFRADPIAAACLTSSIAILMTTRMSPLHIVAAAGLSALAALVTIKSALYMPAYLAVLVWRKDERGILLRIILAGCLAAALAGFLYLWHSAGITPAVGNETSSNAKDALSTTLLESGFLPRVIEVRSWVLFSLAQIVLILAGLAAKRDMRLRIVLILFAVPFLSVVIYRNAFVYFFPFAVPLMMISAAVGAQAVEKPGYRSRLVLIMLASAVLQLALIWPERMRPQRATLAEVHRLFDAPVAYIDDSHIVSTFPNAGFFMSSWGVKKYRAAGQPVFADVIAQSHPPMLIANKFALIHTMTAAEEADAVLLPEDHKLLRRSYLHYAGPIWLAGGKADLTENQTLLQVPFPGPYRLESERSVKINGQVVRDGAVVALETTDVFLEGEVGQHVRLIWDTGTAPRSADSLDRTVYAGFGALLR